MTTLSALAAPTSSSPAGLWTDGGQGVDDNLADVEESRPAGDSHRWTSLGLSVDEHGATGDEHRMTTVSPTQMGMTSSFTHMSSQGRNPR